MPIGVLQRWILYTYWKGNVPYPQRSVERHQDFSIEKSTLKLSQLCDEGEIDGWLSPSVVSSRYPKDIDWVILLHHACFVFEAYNKGAFGGAQITAHSALKQRVLQITLHASLLANGVIASKGWSAYDSNRSICFLCNSLESGSWTQHLMLVAPLEFCHLGTVDNAQNLCFNPRLRPYTWWLYREPWIQDALQARTCFDGVCRQSLYAWPATSSFRHFRFVALLAFHDSISLK